MSEERAGFPAAFLWGAATSAHQVEGDSDDDWSEFERRPGAIHDGSRAGSACGWWAGRAEEDLALAASLGQRAHRMSLAWSRLEPEPGHFDDAAFDRYGAILDAGRAHGLEMMVTLHHFALPRWVARRGAWLWPELPARFARLAEEVARRLGDRATLWATLNEPSVVAYLGYVGREWPPARGDVASGFRALARMLCAHAAGYRAFKAVRPEARVGIVMNQPRFLPARPGSWVDRGLARVQAWTFYGSTVHALATGTLLPPLALVPERVEGLRGSVDFYGLNYYGAFDVAFDIGAASRGFGRHVQRPSVRTPWTDWGKIHPDGLRDHLLELRRLGVPLYVTENGVMTRDDDAGDDGDALRRRYLVAHLGAVREALAAGADVRGYFHWSLIDNFEWAEGWAPRFGLVAVDRATGARRPRPSARLYADIIRSRALPDGGDETA